jgi:hypothetical protein
MAKDVKKQEVVNPETLVNGGVQTETKHPAGTGVNSENPETKVIVVQSRFRDKTDGKTLFVVGQELEFDAERANDVVSRGLAKFKAGNE